MAPEQSVIPDSAEEPDRETEEYRRALRRAIDLWRQARGLSYNDLAEISHTSISTVNRLINTEGYWPRQLQLRSILEAVGLDPDEPDLTPPVIVQGVIRLEVGNSLDDLTLTEQHEVMERVRLALQHVAADVRSRENSFRPVLVLA